MFLSKEPLANTCDELLDRHDVFGDCLQTSLQTSCQSFYVAACMSQAGPSIRLETMQQMLIWFM